MSFTSLCGVRHKKTKLMMVLKNRNAYFYSTVSLVLQSVIEMSTELMPILSLLGWERFEITLRTKNISYRKN